MTIAGIVTVFVATVLIGWGELEDTLFQIGQHSTGNTFTKDFVLKMKNSRTPREQAIRRFRILVSGFSVLYVGSILLVIAASINA